jgi:hypothetical protein
VKKGKERMTNRNDTIVFCTTCKGRTMHLSKTLPFNIACAANFHNSKFVVLDYGSTDNLQEYIQQNHADDIESGRLTVYSYKYSGPFHMAHAKNMVHRLGILEGGSVLVNLDADNYTSFGFSEYLQRKFAKNRNKFMWAHQADLVDRPRGGISGRIVVRAHDFLKVGGYDEKYSTWGPDDKDFHARLRRMGLTGEEIEERYLYLIPHGPGMRFQEYPHARVNANAGEDAIELEIASDSTIANWGKFGMGTVFKNFDVSDNGIVHLRRVPTRIFGIGLHKTATTSLHVALKILGYDSAHWEGTPWSRAIWEEVTSNGKSKTLEEHYALCDLPIGLLYKELDEAYPGSKFILTTRNEDEWVRSVENHWNPNINPFRKTWDSEPFTHKMHHLLYQQKTFNKEVFLDRYRKHNSDVIEYFKHRPNDLLVMPMSLGAGWKELCSFLGDPVPATEYPFEFKTITQET